MVQRGGSARWLADLGTRTYRTGTFYVGDIQEVGRRINEALPHDPPLPVQLSVTDDPTWSEYEAMLSATGAGG